MKLPVIGMWLCCVLFFIRIYGQIIVGLYGVDWLPPMKDWYSGLIPYPILMPLQVLVLSGMVAISNEQHRHGNDFIYKHPTICLWLRRFAYLYGLIMATRYLIALKISSITRWYQGGLIPVLFHFVLAGFIWLAVYQRNIRTSQAPPNKIVM